MPMRGSGSPDSVVDRGSPINKEAPSSGEVREKGQYGGPEELTFPERIGKVIKLAYSYNPNREAFKSEMRNLKERITNNAKAEAREEGQLCSVEKKVVNYSPFQQSDLQARNFSELQARTAPLLSEVISEKYLTIVNESTWRDVPGEKAPIQEGAGTMESHLKVG